ncbi:MAG: hypothetical protein HY352_01120 [Candidatus Omnitrophica bacterium]|nr:hypothetical protein [Candidatus Omnitrophota bacterium]
MNRKQDLSLVIGIAIPLLMILVVAAGYEAILACLAILRCRYPAPDALQRAQRP